MKFLADENVEWRIIKQLRGCGYDVTAVSEILRGGNDDDVLQLALKEKRILITNDTDFGRMIFKQIKPSCGLILMRFSCESPEKKIKVLKHLLKYHEKKLFDHFTVISDNQIKIRPLN